MGCGGSIPAAPAPPSDPEEPVVEHPLVQVLDSCQRLWDGPCAGIFFAEDPVPAIQAYCETNGIKFEDPDFSPNGSYPNRLAEDISPLTRIGRNAAESEQYSNLMSGGDGYDGTLEWLRCEDIPREEGQELSVIDDLCLTDVNQGGAENCFMCAVLCGAINKNPELLRTTVAPATPSPVGAYSVRLWVEGRWAYLPIDDRIACKDGACWDMHSKQAHEMYVPLIAKAIAKWLLWYDLNGDDRDIGPDGVNARTIDEGSHLYLYRALTGLDHYADLFWADKAKDKYISRKDAAPLVREQFAKGVAATCGGAVERRSGMMAKMKGNVETGLIDTHAYTVLWYGTIEGIEFVQLRNPWGEDGEWKGDWSDESKMWEKHPNVRDALEALKGNSCDGRVDNSTPYSDKRGNDGIFFMTFDDFMKYWAHIEYVW